MAREILGLFREAISEWDKDNVPSLSASLAFYTLLSLAPLLLIVVSIAGLVFGSQEAQDALVGQAQALVGPAGAEAIRGILVHVQAPGKGILSLIVGVGILFFGASGVFTELQTSLHRVWHLPPKAGGWMLQIRERFFAFLMIVVSAFLLLASLLFSAGLAAIEKFAAYLLPLPPLILEILNLLLSFLIISAIFALIFRYVPEAGVAWRDALVGGVVSAVLFDLGKLLIGLYLGRTAFVSAYGAAGSLVVVIAWVYYSAQVVFLGAEFTGVYAKRYGAGIRKAGPAGSKPASPTVLPWPRHAA